MPSKMLRTVLALDLEERILNASAAVALASVALPWMSGDWPGGEGVRYSGLGFATAYIGFAIFLLNLALLLITVIPLIGGPVLLQKRNRESVRLWLSMQSLILVLAALTVLMRISAQEFTRLNVRFGVYVCLAASIVTFFECCQKYIGYRRAMSKDTFHHPEDAAHQDVSQETFAPPPPPPPPPRAPQPEEHRLYP